MAEIYNENVYDLLVPQSIGGGKQAAATARPRLVISEDKKDNTYVKGLRWVFVTSADDILRLVHLARKNMQIAATKLNASSSRRCVFWKFSLAVFNIFESLKHFVT